MVKKLLFKAGDLREVGSRKIPWRREWQPTPVFLPGEFHGQWSLAGLQSMGLQRVGHDLVTEQKKKNTKQQSSTKLPRMHSEERTASLIKGAGGTGQPHAKE